MQYTKRFNFLSAFILTFASLLAVGLPATAVAASGSEQELFADEIRICVIELGKRANYNDANRVVHTVQAQQKNLAEQLFRINTQIFESGKDGATREYNSVCVTRGPVQLVMFRIEGAG